LTYSTYTATGPFADGSSPGISAALLNAVETFLSSGWFNSAITSNHSGVLRASLLQLYDKSQQLSGSTSGTMTLHEYFAGASGYLKICCLRYSNYRNAAASANTITLNTSYNTACYMIGDSIQGTQFLSSGSPITLKAFTTLGGTSDGTGTSTTTLHQYSIAQGAPFSAVSEPGSNGSALSGSIIMIGF